MKNYRLKEDNKDHYVLHDTKDKSDFKVSKMHLDPSMLSKVSKIQKFDVGGTVDPLQNAQDINAWPEPITNAPQDQTVPKGEGADYFEKYLKQFNVGGTDPQKLQGVPQNQDMPQAPSATVTAELQPQGEAQTQPQAQTPNQLPPHSQGVGTDYFDSYLKQLGDINQQQKAAYDTGAQAAQGAADEQARAYTQQAQQAHALQTNMEQHLKTLDAQNSTITNAISNTQINPNHFWDNQSTGSKIGMLAGMIVSGFGAGAGQGNMAMNIINKAIDQDIAAQKDNLGTKENLLKANMLQYGNLNMAIDATRLNLLAATKGQIDASQAKLGGAMAQQNAALMKSEIDKQMMNTSLQLAQQKAGLDQFKNPQGMPVSQNGQQGIDPNAMGYALLLGKMGYPGGIDPKDRETALKEQSEYEKMQKLLDLTKTTFKTAKENATFTEKYSPSWLKTTREETRKYEGAVDPFLADVKSIMGARASDDVMEKIKKAMPEYSDKPETVSQNLDNVMDIIKSQFSFPVLQNARIVGKVNSGSGSTKIKNFAASNFK